MPIDPRPTRLAARALAAGADGYCTKATGREVCCLE